MKIGLFTEFSYVGKSERQAYAEILEQIVLADQLGYDFFSTTESFGKMNFLALRFLWDSMLPPRNTRGEFAFLPASSAYLSTIRQSWRAR
jgi:hypothetical protein